MSCQFELEHIGINTDNQSEALELANTLSEIFNLHPRHGQKSEFAGKYFECMKSPYLGRNGHIAMRTSNLEEAVKELKEKGIKFNTDTAAYDDHERLKNIYIDQEFGGFAIHILQSNI
ncbi:hypothetical protein OWI79_02390 [Mammaliicoccus sciuri]|uniref:2-dehydro-3-deoxyphosphogluconate aldolase n=1 Tax=Mammaliicoccus sciuri TaxID=1296 RepID=A0AAI8DJB4_MAMSC|nr:2-dehydro-3-deoxyphosphogluconate aldolase [Mammaliicoccus sciuri]ASE35519.1 2-dehydro-3-deoxyphosphogluconate aldolase [Mammaliicoccus sciuri]MCY1024536.1 hypothetical protein [Mammaliicoccus sciuri]MRE73012.1 2-dehydro-3-deoxyphosphogluconate aldolase [Mammaliicoccus sciuri]ORI01666.1 2-dehydro-3-deoxyphosphogluconate aldolase [Mammaliicoccus sciuri]